MDKRKLNRLQIVNAFGGKCQICGFDKCIAALSFHHRDPKKKEMAINKFANNNKLTYLQIRELEKCVLLCENCHRMVHNGMLKKELEETLEIELFELME